MLSHRSEIHIDITADNQTAVQLLAEATGLSKQRIKQAMQRGAVWLTHGKNTRRLRRQSKAMKPGDQLHLYYDEAVLNSQPLPARLIADEGAYSVWYKPYGMLSQGGKWGDHCTVYRWAEQHLTPQRNAFIVHRLDRAATGLILIAHQKKATAALAALFQDRSISKRYQVIVHGQFPAGDAPTTIESELDGHRAVTRATLNCYAPERHRSLLDIAIATGRKHQIRRHLASIGFPVVGDRLYGIPADSEDLQLTACHLAFTCPLEGQARVYTLPPELMPTL